METKEPKQQKDGRYRSLVSFTLAELQEIRKAAGTMPVATFIRWAALKVARKVEAP